ncbi:MAG: ATP-binding protein [Planctomycetaceae bacterium]|jgi:signal transduction histidine kinase
MTTNLASAERERLQAKNTELATLAGGLAHEIRNPLSTIGMHLELLAEDLDEEESARSRRMLERVTKLQHECHQLEEILNAFLQFARAGEPQLETGSLNETVTSYLEFLDPLAAEHHVEVRPHLDANLPEIPLDIALLRQVLNNLGRNALQAMPDGGTLEFITTVRDHTIVLEVIDTGRGMDHKTRDRMFQAFFSTRSGGSGLGLPTVRRIIEAHGGTIACDSEPGQGTRFTIRLPLHPLDL